MVTFDMFKVMPRSKLMPYAALTTRRAPSGCCRSCLIAKLLQSVHKILSHLNGQNGCTSDKYCSEVSFSPVIISRIFNFFQQKWYVAVCPRRDLSESAIKSKIGIHPEKLFRFLCFQSQMPLIGLSRGIKYRRSEISFSNPF